MVLTRYLKKKLRWRKQRKAWEKQNAHNFLAVSEYNYFDLDKVHVGNGTYGMLNAHVFNNPREGVEIGSYCGISSDAQFITGEHDYHRLSTFPFKRYIAGEEEISATKGKIVVEDDVFIGRGCIILSNVTIHQGAVIGAGSVVTHDIPPYAIYASGKIVKYRFDEETIQKLLKIDYSKLTYDLIRENIDLLYTDMNDDFFKSELYQKIKKDE